MGRPSVHVACLLCLLLAAKALDFDKFLGAPNCKLLTFARFEWIKTLEIMHPGGMHRTGKEIWFMAKIVDPPPVVAHR